MRNSQNSTAMRAFVVALACAGASLAAGGCGGSSQRTASTVAITDTTPGPTPAWLKTENAAPTVVDTDKDNDVGASHDDTNNFNVLSFGRPARAAELQALTAAIKRYYAVALRENGPQACRLLYSTFAEAVAEDYGQPGAPSYTQGVKTCAAGMKAIFQHYHAQLEREVPKLKVNHALVKGHHAMLILGFGSLPEREIPLQLEGHVWKVATPLDDELP